MSAIVQGVHVPANLARSLGPFLRRTLDLFTEYRRVQNDDAAHWYNERATLSVLAAAAWKQGGIALEEYSIAKSGGRPGRADLWVKLNKEMFSFEAKQTWTSVLPGRARKRAAYWLAKATSDARRIPKAEASWRAGLLFVVPHLTTKKELDFDPASFVEDVASVDHDFRAWWFPQKPWATNKRTERMYPGVVILGSFTERKPLKAKAAA